MEAPEVLVVEDDPELNQIVGAYASMAGYQYRSALNGTDALAQVEHHAPAAIVLDLMLPDMSGFDICRHIKRNGKSFKTRVIILTAMDNEASRIQGRECGADEYLTKPFDPDRLMETVARHSSPPSEGEP